MLPPAITSSKPKNGTDDPMRKRNVGCGHEWEQTPANVLQSFGSGQACAEVYNISTPTTARATPIATTRIVLFFCKSKLCLGLL